MKLRIIRMGGYTDSDGFINKMEEYICQNLNINIAIVNRPTGLFNEYYKGLQFKINIDFEGREYEIADGGFVDWSQKLLENRKERMVISGLGINRLLEMMKGH